MISIESGPAGVRTTAARKVEMVMALLPPGLRSSVVLPILEELLSIGK
jgi:hypothetical protein